jgi:hypothetical protein
VGSGRVTLNFFDTGKHRGGRWRVVFAFRRGEGTWELPVVVAGKARYRVEPPGLAVMPVALGSSRGWHALAVEFCRQSVLVSLDDLILWSSNIGQDAALSAVRLDCAAHVEDGPIEGAVWFDDFTLARAIEDLPHHAADPRQDEVWLVSGDQLFGDVVRADRRAIELSARFGKRTLAWGDVRGLSLRQSREPGPNADAGQVRVWLRAPVDTEPDQLVGDVRALDDRRLTLHHAHLGELDIERKWLSRIAAVHPASWPASVQP